MFAIEDEAAVHIHVEGRVLVHLGGAELVRYVQLASEQSVWATLGHLVRGDEVQQQAQSSVVLHEVLKNTAFVGCVELFLGHLGDVPAHHLAPVVVFVLQLVVDALPESVDQLPALLGPLKLLAQHALDFLLAKVLNLLLGDLLLQVLDLVESPDQAILEELFDV